MSAADIRRAPGRRASGRGTRSRRGRSQSRPGRTSTPFVVCRHRLSVGARRVIGVITDFVRGKPEAQGAHGIDPREACLRAAWGVRLATWSKAGRAYELVVRLTRP